jgi:hypothetical protein
LAKTWADLGKEIKVYPSLHLYEMGRDWRERAFVLMKLV